MKKVFSSFLIDTGKYVLTVLVLSTIISDKDFSWQYYAICLVGVVSIVVGGLVLYRNAEKDEKKKKKKKKQ